MVGGGVIPRDGKEQTAMRREKSILWEEGIGAREKLIYREHVVGITRGVKRGSNGWQRT